MVKNRKAKDAALEYQMAHPGVSYAQARRESRKEHERAQSSTRASSQDEREQVTPPGGSEVFTVDDTSRPVEQPLSSDYLTNPFGLKPADNLEQP
ncbi:hypothetical protein MN2019_24305 [Mycolicibacterium neoaurum]|uniref:hypothetical protein n=1 Tax=Mycolicibacterium neoaurum TaxID=1795 RepID=UPI001BCB5B0D|nr:hypothetical protein [Mycolicibacterium neoaurum]QVI27292.1 hypothetical protein MN2019_24305 [Mycolicibacterium neoaurum]